MTEMKHERLEESMRWTCLKPEISASLISQFGLNIDKLYSHGGMLLLLYLLLYVEKPKRQSMSTLSDSRTSQAGHGCIGGSWMRKQY